MQGDRTAFDWSHFIRAALHIEDNNGSSATDILERAAQMRTSVTSIGRCDVRQMPPLVRPQQYDIVSSNFCAESITDSRQEWRAFVGNISSLVAAGGILLMTALKKATCYSVGRVFFPAVSIDESDLTAVLQDSGFSTQHLVIRSVPADRPSRHYKGLMLAAAMKLG